MNNKSILTGLILVIVSSILFGYSLVFAGNGIFDNTVADETKIVFKLSNNIYLDSLSLNKTNILFKSGEDLNNFKIDSKCDIFSKVTYSKGNYYMFDLKFFDNDCKTEDFTLINEKNEVKYIFKLKLLNKYGILSKMLDLDTDNLIRLNKILDKKILLFSKYDIYNKNIEKNYYTFLEKNRVLNEAVYNNNLIKNILINRDQKYIIPVIGRSVPKKIVKVPNSGRGYRKGYTDGIHHGWDIDGDFGEKVVSLDDGIIVRTVKKFDFSNLNKIKRGDNLSKYDQTRNLDILRGKQVWIKTMKGDVVMYSHLNDIFSNIEIGEVVTKGEPIGTIGVTGVPDKNYKDYHLHFPIHKNPFNLKKGDYYDFDDYMRWDWLLRGKSGEYILQNQGDIFESYG